jgi:hypothetical protein
MGACSFSLTFDVTTEKRFAKAFHAAADEDRYENGNDPYRGTIGQKRGWVMLSSTPVSKTRLEELREKHEGDKWGDAIACPVAEETLVGKPKTKKVKVEASDKWGAYSAARDLFGSDVKLEIKSASKIKDARYALEKLDVAKGWRVKYGWNNEVVFQKKGEAVKKYKELLLAGEKAQIFYTDLDFQRVLVKQARWELEIEVQKFRVGKKVSHYAVWGWAAE